MWNGLCNDSEINVKVHASYREEGLQFDYTSGVHCLQSDNDRCPHFDTMEWQSHSNMDAQWQKRTQA